MDNMTGKYGSSSQIRRNGGSTDDLIVFLVNHIGMT